MLGTKMMYYPFVHPPKPVLWQALLYWDAVTSVAPQGGYQFGRDLEVLTDVGLYLPARADELPGHARSALVSDLREVVETTPGEDLVPLAGPLTANNRLYWGKLPPEIERDLVDIGAVVPDADMLRASPVLRSQLMIVLAKHMAAATRGTIPFTDSRSAYEVAFAPLGPDLAHRRSWQLQVGDFLPVPAPDTPLMQVLDFREAYAAEREELAAAVRRLLLPLQHPPDSGHQSGDRAEIERAVRHIQKAVAQLEKAGHGNGILWLKRSLWVLGGLGVAAAATAVPPLYAALFMTLSSLGVGVTTTLTRPGVSTEYNYLQHLQAILPDTTWPVPQPVA